MELQEIMQSFLPREVIEVFDIQKIEDGAAKEQLDIYLDERRVVPAHLQGLPIVAYGFVEAVTIQDFPIRGKRVFLHLRRRKWLDKSTNRIHTTRFNITRVGTQLTEELVAFLKGAN